MQINKTCGFGAPPYLHEKGAGYSPKHRCGALAHHALILRREKVRFLCDAHKKNYIDYNQDSLWICPSLLTAFNLRRGSSTFSYFLTNYQLLAEASKR